VTQPAAVAVSGFGLRVTPLSSRPFRVRDAGSALVVESHDADDWRSASITKASDVATAAGRLARVAQVEVAPNSSAWWIETPTYRIPLPTSWTLHASGDRTATPLFELRGPAEASISVRATRRMPSIESFEGPGHVFRDIGQLDRAGYIEFEEVEGSRTWLHRHEQLHRGTSPFIVTLRAQLALASEHIPILASIVEQLTVTTVPTVVH
jgi:hypothetical protein